MTISIQSQFHRPFQTLRALKKKVWNDPKICRLHSNSWKATPATGDWEPESIPVHLSAPGTHLEQNVSVQVWKQSQANFVPPWTDKLQIQVYKTSPYHHPATAVLFFLPPEAETPTGVLGIKAFSRFFFRHPTQKLVALTWLWIQQAPSITLSLPCFTGADPMISMLNN